MPLLDFQTALGRLVRAPEGDPYRYLNLDAGEYACLETLAQSPGFRFTAGVQRSWCMGRAVSAGSLTLSILSSDVRSRLLDEWVNAGGGTSSFFDAEADALLNFVADRLPYPSHELTACRLEQATLRANSGSASFTPPDLSQLDSRGCAVRRGRHAAVVFFHGRPDLIMDALLEHTSLPPISREVTAVLFSPGCDGLCRPAAVTEVKLWERLAGPAASAALLREGYRREILEAMLTAGAIECDQPLEENS